MQGSAPRQLRSPEPPLSPPSTVAGGTLVPESCNSYAKTQQISYGTHFYSQLLQIMTINLPHRRSSSELLGGKDGDATVSIALRSQLRCDSCTHQKRKRREGKEGGCCGEESTARRRDAGLWLSEKREEMKGEGEIDAGARRRKKRKRKKESGSISRSFRFDSNRFGLIRFLARFADFLIRFDLF
ncbi:hypothetical protein JCGZ_09032 [Jatropha curcas]|uniref:Uncharacterized protein n=1 Tax=Jatropha curcas TaxID=180498 RepID=A0A067KUS1_JATCU|nr:hypothetical protein JCGZ_09032 [Jatropha curcas]